MTPTTLVTGSSGFAGSAIGRHLRLRCGHRVIGLSRTAPRPESCDAFVAHDLSGPLPPDLPDVDFVVHCAALSSPWAAPDAYERNSVRPVENLVRFYANRPLRRLVFLSSTAVHYRFADQTGLTEETPLPMRPINTYAAAKRTCEAILGRSGLPVTILRPRALFGPGDTVVFPRILHAARRGLLPILTRSDGDKALSDLLYIDTLATYVARVLDADVDGTFILTNAEPVITYDLLDTVFSALGIPRPTRRVRVGAAMLLARAYEWRSQLFDGWREPSVTRFGVASLAYSKTFDVSRALAAFGSPEVAMADGVSRFIDWQRRQPQ